MAMYIFWLVLGLAVLIIGGDFLVKGAVGIAEKFKLSPLVIGMTVVSFGTSAPELIVSIQAALEGVPEIAIGNVVGSNIANIALVLAITVLIFPIVVERNSKMIDWPMMMFSSILFYVFALDNVIEFWEGVVLVTILIAFVIFLIRNSRKNNVLAEDDFEAPSNPIMTYVYLFSGLIGLKFGADWLLEGAVGIAEGVGMSKKVIGVTIVAFGTSVPELVASAVAAYRKQTDISIGNLIGSNIFNILIVIGVTAIVKDTPVDESIISFDMIWMLAIALGVLPLMLIGKKMGRIHGLILLSAYLIFIGMCLANIN